MTEGDRKSLTYFLFDGTYVKVGKSTDVDGAVARMKTCQTGNAQKLTLIGVSEDREEDLHKRFEKDHLRGEWYRLSHEMLVYIASGGVRAVYKFTWDGKTKWLRHFV